MKQESKYFPPDFGGATELHVWDVVFNGVPVELHLRGSKNTWGFIVKAPSAKWSANSGTFKASRAHAVKHLQAFLALHFQSELVLVCSSETYVIEEHEL